MMVQFNAFLKKEGVEAFRTGKLLIVTLIAIIFGIMNPLITKLTPQLMKLVSDDFDNMGVTLSDIKVDALMSWAQFFKNAPMLILVFVIMFSGILTQELQKGSLLIILTKGLKRRNVILAKFSILAIIWTIVYWLCFAITYLYNAYYWDNSIVHNLMFSVFLIYMFGLWIISLIILTSVFTSSNYGSLMLIFIIFVASYLLGMISKLKIYVPTYLLSASELIKTNSGTSDYRNLLLIICVLLIFNLVISILVFDKKRI
ncbi:ABC transporter permease subunit [Floricoccus penangensis]|uniref:ABC transporter permease subunit n=1 Tax=Floricoccus penangensis TaxID=1859475 RepID=UPI0020416684|nr:ABC transporter permease subunit [Floricoccus penangensis]URZ86534.1 ABC transporter permease subunit [Floricoccus penangensis]